jgi:hypothetical protein
MGQINQFGIAIVFIHQELYRPSECKNVFIKGVEDIKMKFKDKEVVLVIVKAEIMLASKGDIV